MKKVILISLALLLVPFIAMATMMPITDSQMDEVTAQRGIDLAPIDVNLDLRIENIAYIDADHSEAIIDPLTGATIVGNVDPQMIAGIPNPYTQGVINITGLQIDNLHATLAGVIVDDGNSNVDALGNVSIFANPISIDVETYDNVPLVALRGHTSVVISLPDLSLTIDKITIADISFDATVAAVSVGGYDANGDGIIQNISDPANPANDSVEEGILNPLGTFDFTPAATDPAHSIGSIEIAGLKLRTYSCVGGFNATTGAPINPGHRGVIIIQAH